MLQVLASPGGRTRLRLSVLALLTLLVGNACDSTDPVATNAPSDVAPIDATVDAEPTAAADIPAQANRSGVPYGPVALWSSYTSMKSGHEPFTMSQNYTDAGGVIKQINTARSRGVSLVLAMTGGSPDRYKTNGAFSFTKWKAKMNTFETSAIKQAVAQGLADGTVVGNLLADEPETPRWGRGLDKGMLDDMAAYAKRIFPGLPMGINVGPPGYRWRSSERFRQLDYVLYQYNHWVTEGNISEWRQDVLAQANRDGVTPAFSLNVLDGGVQDRKGSWDCSGGGQAGRGTYSPNCRMTPDQVRDWGGAIGGSGCFMLMWRYDDAYMSKSANRDAFRDVGSMLSSKSRRSCRR